MRNIEDYKRKEVYIKVNTIEEAEKIVPLLNTIYSDWRVNNFKNFPRYVNMYNDVVTENKNSTYQVIEASEFFEEELTVLPEKWSLIINNINDIKPYLLKKYGKIDSFFENAKQPLRLFSNETNYVPPSYVSTNLKLLDGYTEITLEQFKKHFPTVKEQEVTTKTIDFSKLDLDEWLIETKKLNLSLDELKKYISLKTTCNYEVYSKLKGDCVSDKAKILYDEWNNKPQFEAGKWYTYSNAYIKIKSNIIKKDRVNGEVIEEDEYLEDSYWSNEQFIKNAVLLTDLSEIQEFLPDGHIDKIITKKDELIPKTIYYHGEDDMKWLSRYRNSSSNTVYVINSMCFSGSFYKEQVWGSLEGFKKNLRLATPDEIEWFELCEKAGRYVDKPIKKEVMEKQTEFKKGDYIVVLKDNSLSNNWQNFIFKQLKYYHNICPEILINGNENIDGQYTYAHFDMKDFWRYATSEEIAKYDRIGKPYDVTTLIKKSNQKHIKDLKYPDVVEINSKEEYDKIANINGYDMPYSESDKAYLICKDGRIGYGKANCMEAYHKDSYNHYKFSDLIFPESSVMQIIGNGAIVNMNQIQKEAKRRFPIGCTFRSIGGYTHILINDSVVYKISNNGIWANKGNGCLYQNGKWATLISLPQEENITPDKETLIAEAKRKYPTGTKVKDFNNGNEGTINWEIQHRLNHESPYYCYNGLYIGTEESNGDVRITVFENGKWAEIISLPDNNNPTAKSLTLDDLRAGYYYSDGDVIFTCKKNKNTNTVGIRISSKAFRIKNAWDLEIENLRLATEEEIKWLDLCVYNDRYIDKSDNTIPEYVECIYEVKSYNTHPDAKEYGAINYSRKLCTKNKIYKVKNTCLINSNVKGYCLEDENGLHYLIDINGVKPSTKEAYDKYHNTPIVNTMSTNNEVFYNKELPNNNNQINKLQKVQPKLIEIKKLN